MHDQEKIFELINKSIDRTSSDHEEQLLRERMTHDPEVRRLYDETLNLSNMLRKVTPVEPPMYLRQQILNSIPVPRRGVQEKSIFQRWGITSLFVKHQVAFSLFAGLVLGMMILAVIFGMTGKTDLLNVSQVYGTLTDRSYLDRATSVGRSDFATADISARVQLNDKGGVLVLDLMTKSRNITEYILSFEPSALAFEGFRQLDGSVLSTVSSDHTAAITLQGGSRTALIFSRKLSSDVSIRLTVIQDGKLQHEQTLFAGAD